MEHSLHKYLERLSTDKLVCFLQQCLKDEQQEDYTDVIPFIQQELAKRGLQE